MRDSERDVLPSNAYSYTLLDTPDPRMNSLGRGSWPQMILRLSLLLFVATFLVLQVLGADAFQERCLSFKPELHIANSSRWVLDYVPAGTNLTFPYNDVTCGRPSQVVSADLCRAALSISTSERSSIIFELWLPRDWSGRFLGTGNGGIDGCPCRSIH